MDTLKFVAEKYGLDLEAKSPIAIPDVGRNDLADLFCELGYKVGVEIGVFRGVYSEVLCKANPELMLYSIDPWMLYPTYRDFRKKSVLDDAHAMAAELLSPYNCEMIKKTSMEAVGAFEDESVDFVYIDANHELVHVTNDIVEWSKKVRPGGIVSGHDYIKSKSIGSKNHVVHAVNACVAAYRIRPWFLFGAKHRTKSEGEIRDKQRSWMWVKE